MTAVHKRSNAQRRRIDREFPHQVAIESDFCCMENYEIIAAFCRQFDPPPQHRFVNANWPDGTRQELRLFCFSRRADAEMFAAHFEGEHFDPARDRGKGRDRDVWRRTGSWISVDRFGPLTLPKFFREHP